MIRRIRAGLRRMGGLYYPGRSLVILPDDIFLVSYPKSGNTWARFLIANLVHPETPASFSNIHELIPDPEATTKKQLERTERPRIIKSHSCFDPRYPRVIYVVRDPRDVLISQYHYHRKCRKIADDFPLEQFLDGFLKSQPEHGSWGENVSTWVLTRRDSPDFLLLRYEDMISDTPRELSKIAKFLGIEATGDRVSRAVERSSAGQMRQLEKAQSDLPTLARNSRQDLPFVRSASMGGWKSELPDSLAAAIEAAWAPLMTSLGYETHAIHEVETPAAELFNGIRR